jgi:3-methyladenine DNA glycosylase/8-oxoguanine DNA glycosylase
VNPYALLAGFLVVLGAALSTKSTDTIRRIAAERSSQLAAREQEMSKTPPQWENLTAMEKAVDHMLAAASDLSFVRDECFEDDPYKGFLGHTVNLLRDMATALLPPREGWPEPKEGMGKVLPFIPRQTG